MCSNQIKLTYDWWQEHSLQEQSYIFFSLAKFIYIYIYSGIYMYIYN